MTMSFCGTATDAVDTAEKGFFNLIGLRPQKWKSDRAVFELHIEPKHLNNARVQHGGVLTAIIDIACGYAGCFCTVSGNVRKALPLALTTSFTGQATAGTVRVTGRKRAGGRKIFVSSAEVVDADGALIAMGEGGYRYRSGSERLEEEPA